MADAVEEHGDRDADEFIASSWAGLDDLHTLFRGRAAGGLDFFARMRADVGRDGTALTIGADEEARLPRTRCDVFSLRMASPWSANLHMCDAASCVSDEWHPHATHDARHPAAPPHTGHAANITTTRHESSESLNTLWKSEHTKNSSLYVLS